MECRKSLIDKGVNHVRVGKGVGTYVREDFSCCDKQIKTDRQDGLEKYVRYWVIVEWVLSGTGIGS